MKTVGVKDLKNRLSYYLSFVKSGEDLLITERGKAVARIITEDPERTLLRNSLRPLIMKGLVSFPSQSINKDIPDPLEVPGRPVSEMVIEDRR